MPLLRRCSAAAVGLLAVPLAAPPAHALDAPALVRALDAHAGKLGSASGSEVVDLTANRVLYARRPDLALAPASNEKLYTTASALLKFGPTARLRTTVAIPAGIPVTPDGTLDGDLYLIGGGDPSLGDTGLLTLAREVTDAGVLRVRGSVRGDESYFDRLRGSYDTAFKPDWDLGGLLGALTWGHGASDKLGPAHRAAARLQALLKARHVTFDRRARTGRIATAGGAGDTIATLDSPPMSSLVAATNLPSDNFYAEMLLKGLGARFGANGSTTAGAAVVRATVAPFGVSPRIVDGSGLSRDDRTTPRQLVTFVGGMLAEPVASRFMASLPVAGRTGTLRRRMRGTAAAGVCRAKTGTLIGVSSLTGTCRARDGHVLAFSFIENRINAGYAKRHEDRMVAAIARYDG